MTGQLVIIDVSLVRLRNATICSVAFLGFAHRLLDYLPSVLASIARHRTATSLGHVVVLPQIRSKFVWFEDRRLVHVLHALGVQHCVMQWMDPALVGLCLVLLNLQEAVLPMRTKHGYLLEQHYRPRSLTRQRVRVRQ